ncbi:hypothetical protein [Devosia sp. RR2S18]|uniref:hypothetical protein n=1 Tax=Devosia rhizosphaerae TaxID=3049774 RepID=UPI0025413039|nr:hypothetical protein [Devosia sp. RR2S18]WIJ23406.1 hypothetical protein QOV41_09920 [Devosia sp. RR2S18]
MLRLFCSLLVCLMPAAAAAEQRMVFVDASSIVREIAEAIGADYVGLPRQVQLSAEDAAAACGLEPLTLTARCSAVLATPELVQAMGDGLPE